MIKACLWRIPRVAFHWRPLLFPRTPHVPQVHVERFASSKARDKEQLAQCPALSPSEALGALRTFYLAVHPDFFTRFPREKATNEESLKLLNSYLDALESGQRPHPLSLTFYIHPANSGGTAFNRLSNRLRAVAVSLDSLSVGSAVYDILGSCDFSGYLTEDVRARLVQIKEHDELGRTRTEADIRAATQSAFEERDWEKEWDVVFNSRLRDGGRGAPTYLDKWLAESLSHARECLEASLPIRRENDSTIRGLCSEFNLRSITTETDWMAATLRGHLHNLRKSLQCQRAPLMSSLDSAVALVLGYAHGVDVNGRILLNCEETVQQWVQFLPSALHLVLKSQETLDPMERELSALIGGVTLQRPSEGDVPLDAYAHWLASYLRSCRQQPATVGSEAFRGCLVTLSRPDKSLLPSISETGGVSVPVSCPPRRLVEFLREGWHRIEQLKREHERQQKIAYESLAECQTALRLSSLMRTPSVSDAQSCQCCSQLVQKLARNGGSQSAQQLREGLAGHYLSISTYYSASADGDLRVPWNFELLPHGSSIT